MKKYPKLKQNKKKKQKKVKQEKNEIYVEGNVDDTGHDSDVMYVE